MSIDYEDASAEMVEIGGQQIREIDAAISDIDTRIAALQASHTAGVQNVQEHSADLASCAAKMQEAESEYDQAAAYAKLAVGTANEKNAVAAAASTKKAYQTARKEYERLAKAHSETCIAVLASAQDMEQQLHLLQFERETREAERQAVQRGISQALNEVGKHRHAQIVEEYQRQAAAVEAIREQLLAAQIELTNFYRASIESLAPWPAMQKEVRALQSLDDPTVRIFEAAMYYIQVLAQDITQLDTAWPASTWNVRNALVIPEQIYNMPGALREKHMELARLLNEYLTFKQDSNTQAVIQ